MSAARSSGPKAIFRDGVRVGFVAASGAGFIAQDAAGARIGFFGSEREALHAVHDAARLAKLKEDVA